MKDYLHRLITLVVVIAYLSLMPALVYITAFGRGVPAVLAGVVAALLVAIYFLKRF